MVRPLFMFGMNVATLGQSTNINNYTNVKKTITTLAFALSILCISAQEMSSAGQCASKPTPDAKLLSTTIDGDYKVCKWLVPQGSVEDADNEFSVRYQINISRMISSYANNSKEVAGLRSFVEEITTDKEKKISRINICGYASPDGDATTNKRLATARAVDCREFINKEFNLAKYPGKTEGIAQPWSATKESVSKSSIPNKAEVLKLVESRSPAATIEMKLKEMPNSWEYMASNILPPMRCVEIEVVYTGWTTMETRTRIEPEVVEEVVVESNNYFLIFTERPSDIYTFTNPAAAPLDFKGCRRDYRGKEHIDRSRYKIKNRRHSEKVKSDSRGFFRHRKEKVRFR